MQPLRILMVTAEYAPFAKAGGLADMVAGLSRVLAGRGHDVRVVMPRYRVPGFPALPLAVTAGPLTSPVRISGTHPPVTLATGPVGPGQPVLYAVDAPGLVQPGEIYGGGSDEGRRFALLAHAALQLCPVAGFSPDVIHCHDWHTALVPLLLATPSGTALRERGVRSVLTLHNIGYQGIFAGTLANDFGLGACEALLPEADRNAGTISFLRAGIERADALTTVSPTHARELLTEAYGHGLDELLRARSGRLTGILNGIDDEAWDPATDALLPANFHAGDRSGRIACRHELLRRAGLDGDGLPVIGCVSRLAAQKGLHLLIEALPPFLEGGRLVAVVLGNGDPTLAARLARLATRFAGRFAFIDRHDETLARLVYAGADALTVPSLYEPCGLSQLYALRYGCVPVVRATGGLRDTVSHFDPATGVGTGSVFQDADPGGLAWALEQLLAWHGDGAAWTRIQSNGMAADFSWRRQVLAYEDLYRSLA